MAYKIKAPTIRKEKKDTFKIGEDLKKDVEYSIDSLAKDHIHINENRYYGMSKSDVESDLYVNYDIDSEIEREEEVLNRKLNDKEKEYYKNKFRKAVVKNYRGM